MAKLKILDNQSKKAPLVASPTSKRKVEYRGNAALVTLGCAKNQVDSEVMLGVLQQSGFQIVNDLKDADVAIVNTCGFLESAVKESIDAILTTADYKKSGRLRKLLVSGCMVERYKGEIETTMPEVDGFLTTSDLLKVADAAIGNLDQVLDPVARPYFLYDDSMPRVLASEKHFAYVKISEGCNRPCTFCIIPRIRGAMRSRDIDSIVREVEALGKNGVKEINLVAQDLTAFGSDTGEGDIVKLLTAIDKTGAVEWVRLLYAYPLGINDGLLKAIANLPSICNYLDIPLQHSSEAVLAKMKRPLGRFSPRSVVEKIRTVAPEISIRTTFIVGFPGETEADVDDLEQFILEGNFTNVGIFTYSREEGTPSFEMEAQVPQEVKEERRARLMSAQQKVVTKRLKSFVGTTQRVLLDGEHPETELLLSGRTYFQAPEVDGTVLINSVNPAINKVEKGRFYMATITGISGYDLMGEITSCDII